MNASAFPPLPPPYEWREHNELPCICEDKHSEYTHKRKWYVWAVPRDNSDTEIREYRKTSLSEIVMKVPGETTKKELAQAMFNIFTFMEK
jgi:hypothetical protein